MRRLAPGGLHIFHVSLFGKLVSSKSINLKPVDSKTHEVLSVIILLTPLKIMVGGGVAVVLMMHFFQVEVVYQWEGAFV